MKAFVILEIEVTDPVVYDQFRRLAIPTVTAHGGQFVVRGLPIGSSKASLNPTNTYVRLDPAVVAVSCERIKQALYDQLHLAREPANTIAISLRPVRNHNDPFDLISVSYKDGWSYRLELPDEVNRSKAVRALVHVMLLEVANRGARKDSVEVPPWLSEGLAAHLGFVVGDGGDDDGFTREVVLDLTSPRST